MMEEGRAPARLSGSPPLPCLMTAPASVSVSVSEKRFLVAFSFSEEARDFVRHTAALLTPVLGRDRILYDEYHVAEFARHDRGRYVPRLQSDASALIVPVLCPGYERNLWQGWEWAHIHGLLTSEDGHRVMPCRFRGATVEGLAPGAGFLDLDHRTPEEAARLILDRLEQTLGLPRGYYTLSTPGGAPRPAGRHNLPKLQPFFGRARELEKLRDALDAENRTWGAVIDGPGGMGKTSLAVRAALECPAGQFDRIIFISIKDRELEDDGEVKTQGNLIISHYTAMLHELARELGMPDFQRMPEGERVRAVLDALRDTRALLILDNLESFSREDRGHVLTLVKRLPEGCKAILTSRRRIGSGADTLILEKLDQEAALETLAELAKHNPLLARTSEAERIALYKQTGGKPLLLRWTAGQMGRGHCRTFADALAHLRSCPPGNDPLEFIFGDLAAEFTEEETKVLAALTYFTLPATVEHLAGVAGLEEDVTERALKGLANRSLMTPDEEEREYALVPLVAEFLRSHRLEAVREGGDRLVNRAVALVMENGGRKHALFPVLDAAWPSITPAIPLLVAGENERLQEVCIALQDFLDFTGRWDEWLSLNRQAEEKAVAAGDHENAGWRAYNTGWVNYLRAEAGGLLTCAGRAEAHWQAAGAGVRERATALRLRGFGHQMNGDYPAALAVFQKALELDRSLSPESRDVASALNSVAGAHQRSGDDAGAERDYREALRVARAVGFPEGVAISTGNLAAVALEREDWPGAETLAREALPLCEALGRQESIASNCKRLAMSLLRQGQAAEGLPYARRAVEIFARLGHLDLTYAQAILQACEAAVFPPARAGGPPE